MLRGMGRNFPSATELIRQLTGELKQAGDVLGPVERHIIQEWCEYAMNNRAAIANAASLHPVEMLLVMLLIEEHKKGERVEICFGPCPCRCCRALLS
jgi:hypothetical protein